MRQARACFAALSLLALAAPPASACGWLWSCGGDRAYRPHRAPPGAHDYRRDRVPARAYRPAWTYGYTNPARARGNAYAPWPSTSMPQARWYLRSALRVPNAGTLGLSAPYTSAQGLLESALPGWGPTVYGPDAAPVAGYDGYGAPQYGYAGGYAPRRGGPPPDAASWWIEPRRR